MSHMRSIGGHIAPAAANSASEGMGGGWTLDVAAQQAGT